MKKRIIALCLMLVLVFSFAGCGSKEKTIDEILTAAQKKSQEAKSGDAKATFTLKASSGKETIGMDMNMDMNVFTDPAKLKTVISMNIDAGQGDAVNQNMEMYVIQENEEYYTYMSVLGSWMKMKLDKSEFEESMNSSNSEAYLNTLTEIKDSLTSSEVEEDGKKLIKLEGTVTGESMKKLIETSGVDDQLSSANLDISAYENLGDIQISVYFDKEAETLYKISMDMKNMMQKALEAEAGEEEVAVDECLIEAIYENFNAGTDFELPEAAKNAVLMDEDQLDGAAK